MKTQEIKNAQAVLSIIMQLKELENQKKILVESLKNKIINFHAGNKKKKISSDEILITEKGKAIGRFVAIASKAAPSRNEKKILSDFRSIDDFQNTYFNKPTEYLKGQFYMIEEEVKISSFETLSKIIKQEIQKLS